MTSKKKRHIVFANRKNGCGKTTTAVSVAHALAKKKHRVLLIDIDPQAHATIAMGLSPERINLHIGHLLDGKASLNQIISPTHVDNIYIAPSSPDLAGYEITIAKLHESEVLLYDKINSEVDHFDYVIFDPPPTGGLLAVTALVAAREVYIPIPMHSPDMEGLGEMMQLIYRVNATWNPTLKLSGIIPTFYNRNMQTSRKIGEDIVRNFGQDKLLSGVRMNNRLAEASDHGRTIFEYAPQSSGAMDYWILTQQIENLSQEIEYGQGESYINRQIL